MTDKLPLFIKIPEIEPGYRCPGCGQAQGYRHGDGCKWQIGPRDPADQAFRPWVEAGYQILTMPVSMLPRFPLIEALEILDAKVMRTNPWGAVQPEPADPFYRAGTREPCESWAPTLLLRIRHPIAVRAPIGSMLMYERIEEFAQRVRDWRPET